MEFGNGFAAARLKGSQNNDPIYHDRPAGRIRTRTNNAGGMAGGITNGEELVMRIAVKPTSSIRKEQETTTVDGEPARITVHGRHDPCICPRVVPVAESMVALTIMDHLTRQRLLRGVKGKRGQGELLELIDRDIRLLRELRKGLGPQFGKRVSTRY